MVWGGGGGECVKGRGSGDGKMYHVVIVVQTPDQVLQLYVSLKVDASSFGALHLLGRVASLFYPPVFPPAS